MNPLPINLNDQLEFLNLTFIRQHYETAAKQAAQKQLSHLEFLAELVAQEAQERTQRQLELRLKNARFPVLKTLDRFSWNHPQKIDRQQIQHAAHLDFIEQKVNVIFCGGVGLGKTHLAIALAYLACVKGYSVRFATAVDIVNTLAAAHRTNRLLLELKKYLTPRLLVIDELGYLPIDKQGADLLYQVISQRYERGSIILTTNRIFKDWAIIFNNDSTIASAILDRLMHHSEIVLIEGQSYRMKDKRAE